ncbi:hypothetical protein Y1Q_0020889 [Alligator mississippiensis]|uniref:Uncharacterized protein n=1 Tax=Alligator mississippiensis TaxID=8496 RepID=A0A151NJ94_ALLMI|nr:hypothetical protein Y1Q_0020889 [Alligator mississippiensis]
MDFSKDRHGGQKAYSLTKLCQCETYTTLGYSLKDSSDWPVCVLFLAGTDCDKELENSLRSIRAPQLVKSESAIIKPPCACAVR